MGKKPLGISIAKMTVNPKVAKKDRERDRLIAQNHIKCAPVTGQHRIETTLDRQVQPTVLLRVVS